MKTEVKNLDLTRYKFPVLTGIDISFSTLDTDLVLLKEAELRGFQDHANPYCKLFNTLFFTGGKVKFKQGLNEEFKKTAWRYLRAFMSSFSPKHEHKEAISAMLLSELVEPELDNA